MSSGGFKPMRFVVLCLEALKTREVETEKDRSACSVGIFPLLRPFKG